MGPTRCICHSSETVKESLLTGLIDSFTYYMDEQDKEWLDHNNKEARGEGTSLQGAVSASGVTGPLHALVPSEGQRARVCPGCRYHGRRVQTGKLVMAIFEKVTHDKTEFLHHVCPSAYRSVLVCTDQPLTSRVWNLE
jgi:enhancer of polycomb-like protein